jgi:hypothetical protein
MTKGAAKRELTLTLQKLDADKIKLCDAYKEINKVLDTLFEQDTFNYYQCHKCTEECEECEPPQDKKELPCFE